LKFGKLEIPSENVILFDNTVDSLTDFVETMVKGKIRVVEDLDAALEELDEGMESIAENVDKNEQTNLLYQL
jgi:nitroimidazol reductase NimA-like FMN-containing flavoprotein (pyridoxamine 5'-phosphate oxidase superfamily)